MRWRWNPSEEGGLVITDRTCPMLSPSVSSKWVIAKVKEVSRKTSILFAGMEDQVEALFREIERRRCVSLGQESLQRRARQSKSFSRELLNLLSSINYESDRRSERKDMTNQRDRMAGRVMQYVCRIVMCMHRR